MSRITFTVNNYVSLTDKYPDKLLYDSVNDLKTRLSIPDNRIKQILKKDTVIAKITTIKYRFIF